MTRPKTRTLDSDLRAVLELDLNCYERKLERRYIEYHVRLALQQETRSVAADVSEGAAEILRMLVVLRGSIARDLDSIFELRRRNTEFNVRFSKAVTEDERRQLIIEYAESLGANAAQIRGDWNAFARWFGHDAVTDRYARRHSELERRLMFSLGRVGVLAAAAVHEMASTEAALDLWRRIEIEATVKGPLAYDGDSRVVSAAFRSLSTALQAMPESVQELCITESTLQYIYRSAVYTEQDVWIQCEAIQLLEGLSRNSLERVLRARLAAPAPGDDLFVRRRAVEALGRNLERRPGLADLFPKLVQDPSPFVRQGVSKALVAAPLAVVIEWLPELLHRDAEPGVRGAALLELLWLVARGESRLVQLARDELHEVLRTEQDAFVLRVAIHVAADATRILRDCMPTEWLTWAEQLAAGLERLHVEADRPSVRRWAAQGRERIWLDTDEDAREVRKQIEPSYLETKPATEGTLPADALEGERRDTTGRVLAALCQESYGCEVRRGWRRLGIFKWHRFRFRFWRFLHEMKISAPDKRQAHDHTVGRVFRGDLRVPSSILCELAQTRVPGEPLFYSDEGGWRPYLPLVDDVLSSLDQSLRSRPVSFYTSEGVTELRPPAKLSRRVRAYWKISRRFEHYARLRNWRSKSDGSPKAYLEALVELGFEVSIRPHREDTARLDPSVTRFFPAMLPASPREFWDSITQYFFSVYDNSLHDLALFTALATSYFLGNHWHANWTMRRARRAIPLSIGGWGTRGKSGTERLKAALINARGYGFVSKTTGCEAMFLYSSPFGNTREMFLFRPYDKATIWEQRNLVLITEKLGSEVFLWECMGLTPEYVKILQRHWMQDDLTTITNTYPDHEDLQGPAGIDLPQVMCNFIPRNSFMYTTEDQMAPILETACEELGTGVRKVGWLEPGLLTPDILERFPYEEHPNNIALVGIMAEGMGIEYDYSLKEMADRVVPDIGVLKTYPPALVRTRRIEFTNGMSANERHGCLGNWTRLKFDQHRLDRDPEVWVATVVNNRADRIARSKVFASILVRDLSCDRHVLIGNNLTGLKGYIQEAWDEHYKGWTLWRRKEDGSLDDPVDAFDEARVALRIPMSEDEVWSFLRAMLVGLEEEADELNVTSALELWDQPEALRDVLIAAGLGGVASDFAEVARQKLDAYREGEEICERAEAASKTVDEAVDEDALAFLSRQFWNKIYVVEDYYSTGNQVVDHVVESTPPGLRARVIGLQNIKGTGLDFVYRFQAWDACHGICTRVLDRDAKVAAEALQQLSTLREFGVLDRETVSRTVEAASASSRFQKERAQADLNVIRSNLARSEKSSHSQGSGASSAPQSVWVTRVIGTLESFFDAGDSIRRRKVANRIYRDLIAERISQERAVVELQRLNKRQKGGWLIQQVHGWSKKLRAWKRLVLGKGWRRSELPVERER